MDVKECVSNITVDNTYDCIPPCTGLVVTSFSKSENNKDVNSLFQIIINDYNKYKTITPYPAGFNGKHYGQINH